MYISFLYKRTNFDEQDFQEIQSSDILLKKHIADSKVFIDNKSTMLLKRSPTLIRNIFLFAWLVVLLIFSRNSGYASIEYVDVKIAAPTALAAINVGETSFTAKWTAVNGATSYKVYVALKLTAPPFAGSYIPIIDFSTLGTSVDVKELSFNSDYRYYVTAFQGITESVNSNLIDVHTQFNPPTNMAATSITNHSFVANWTNAVGATSYSFSVFDVELNQYINSGVTTSNTTYLITGLKPSHKYSYSIRSINEQRVSGFSNPIEVTTSVVPAPVVTDPTNITISSFTANWINLSGVSSYKIWVTKRLVSGYTYIFSPLINYTGKIVSGSSTFISGLDAGGDYRIILKAVQDGIESENSNQVLVYVKPIAPTVNQVVDTTSTTATASWLAVAGSSSFKLYVYTKLFLMGNHIKLFLAGYDGKTIMATSAIISGLNPNSNYFYSVVTLNETSESDFSNEVAFRTKLAAPFASAADRVNSLGFTANWTPVEGVADYKLFVYKYPGFGRTWNIVSGYNGKTVSGSSATITGLTSNSDYKYYLKSVSGSYESDDSNEIFVTTSIGLTAHSIDARTIKISPTPANDFIEISGLNGGELVEVFSITGQILKKYHALNSSQFINVTTLKSGIYFVVIGSKKGIAKIKFIKE